MIFLGAGILSIFCLMFYIEDQMDVGVYDPDPRPHKKN